MTPATIQAFVERLAPADLAVTPCRVFFASEVEMPMGAYGVFVPDASQVDASAPFGSTAIVLNDQEWGLNYYRPMQHLMEVASHEVAHLADIGHQPIAVHRSVDNAAILRSNVAAPPKSPAGAPPWEPCHDLRFIRAAIHLHYRAGLMGHDLDADNVLAMRNIWDGFSPASTYVAALGDEPARCADARLSEVLESPPPPEFTALWLSDTQRWSSTDDSNSRLA